MRTEKDINMIRGQMVVGEATQNDIDDFLEYVNKLEEIVEVASDYDTFGTQGWKYAIGWEE